MEHKTTEYRPGRRLQKKRVRRTGSSEDRVTETPNHAWPPAPMNDKLSFEQLPPDIQMVVLQGVKFSLSRQSRPGELSLLDVDDLLDEEGDDFINRHNQKRTMRQWLDFAETEG